MATKTDKKSKKNPDGSTKNEIRPIKSKSQEKREVLQAAKPATVRLLGVARATAEATVLKLVRLSKKKGVATGDLLRETGLTAGQVRGILAGLIERGDVRRDGSPKASTYHLSASLADGQCLTAPQLLVEESSWGGFAFAEDIVHDETPSGAEGFTTAIGAEFRGVAGRRPARRR